ncbi:MAG: SCP2 sterol-binding domain-containing protein [Clostridia bacterium]|nr:SCP2 sterol-binding domain-containing protein [Clostridia bacterium]
MAKEQFQQELKTMLEAGSGNSSITELLDKLTGLIRQHQDTFLAVTNSYRLTTTDSGITRAFALESGVYRELTDADTTDVTIIGKEQHLLAVFNKKLNPAMALLTGKIKVKGDLGALNTLASYL